MRISKFILAILFACVSVHAALPQLDATIADGGISGWNCNPYGGAATYEVRALIINPYDAMMSVTYSYYDFTTSSLIDGGRACIIAPKESLFCTVSIPVRFGGSGNGTTTLPLHLFGMLDGSSERRVKYVNLSFSHTAATPESGIVSAIASADASIHEAEQLPTSYCDGGACCGSAPSGVALAQAYSLLATARQDLQVCEFSDGLREANDAAALAASLTESFRSNHGGCADALALHRAARANLSRANVSIYSAGACGGNVTASRRALQESSRLYVSSGQRIAENDFSAAGAALRDSLEQSGLALSAIGECPGDLQGSNTTIGQKTPVPTPAGPAGGVPDMISGLLGVLGYIILGAVLIVVAAALYVSFGRKWVDGFTRSAPMSDEPEGGESPMPEGEATEISAVGEEAPLVDHDKIDKEFEAWLNQTEARSASDELEDEDAPEPAKPEPKGKKRKGRE
jgi:hypothetical protein